MVFAYRLEIRPTVITPASLSTSLPAALDALAFLLISFFFDPGRIVSEEEVSKFRNDYAALGEMPQNWLIGLTSDDVWVRSMTFAHCGYSIKKS